jgi:succinyl-CoA synthetase beta subunit
MDVFEILERNGIPVAPYEIVDTKAQLFRAAEKIGYPLVLKAWTKKIIHKTDVGGVVLDNWTKEMLETGFDHLKSRFGKETSVLVQKQIKKGLELYVGAMDDEVFGPMVLFGIGGIYVEVFKDITARICPITEKDVYDMIDDVKAKKIMLGFRGKPVNIKKLASLIVKVSKMIRRERIKELDLNPIKVDENDCVVIDARMVH